MKRMLFGLLAVAGCAWPGWAAEPEPLTTLEAVAALTNAAAARHPAVSFEATVTYYYRAGQDIDVQDGNLGIFVRNLKDISLVPGDRVLITGTTRASFLPYVIATDLKVLRHVELPKPVPAAFDDLVNTHINCRFVMVRGTVRSGDLVPEDRSPKGRLQLQMDGGYVDIDVQSNDREGLKSLIDAEVEVTGVASRKFGGKMQQTGAKVKVSSLADIKVLKRSGDSPWSLPLTPLGEIITGYHVRDLTKRMRVHGTITYYQPGSAVVLQNGKGSLWVSVLTHEPLQIGDVVDATGFPDIQAGHLSLAHAEIRDSGTQTPIVPQLATFRQLSTWARSTPEGHDNDLVSIDGRLVSAVREATQDEYVLVSDGQLFTAIFRHPLPPAKPPAMLQVPPGSAIRVTGICYITDSNPVNEQVPFDILLRSFDDIQIIAEPSLLNVRNLIVVIGLLLAVVMAFGVRAWRLERKVRRQTAAIAYQERRRRRILEDISGSLPLAEIIEQITEVVSARLNGAPCWCQITDGARLGNWPPKLDGLRVIERSIPSRCGGVLGAIFVALAGLTTPSQEEQEGLSMGAGLAALAIETRRLYSDLVHRSEFDLLTEVQNRFSLEKRLDELIQSARETAGLFGLIYIDLDNFKRVNDLYGHQVGDLYLQQNAARLKRQLRPCDLLARLGGDEFGVLVPAVHSRTEVEDIVLRLKHSFEEPFVLDAHALDGTASFGIALYPEDGATKDRLLKAADAAMYAEKNEKKMAEKSPATTTV